MTKDKFRERLYLATVGKEAPILAAKYGLGLELDHYCCGASLENTSFGKGFQQAQKDIWGEEWDIPSAAEVAVQVENDLKISGANRRILHAPFNELFPAAIDPRARKLAMTRFNQAYKKAAYHNVNRMVVHSGFMPFVYFKSFHLQQSINFWTEFMSDKPQDFMLLIENVLEDEPYMLKKPIEGIEKQEEKTGGRHRYGICLDIGHAAVSSKLNGLVGGRDSEGVAGELPVTEWIRVLGKNIAHSHLHCNNGKADLHDVFDCENKAFDMREVMEAFEKYGASDMTYTIEALEPEPCINWLKFRGFL